MTPTTAMTPALIFNLKGDRFLRRMVRVLVSTVVWAARAELGAELGLQEGTEQDGHDTNLHRAGISVDKAGSIMARVTADGAPATEQEDPNPNPATEQEQEDPNPNLATEQELLPGHGSGRHGSGRHDSGEEVGSAGEVLGVLGPQCKGCGQCNECATNASAKNVLLRLVAARNRRETAPSAPAEGLCFVGCGYDGLECWETEFEALLNEWGCTVPVSYTHLRAHETPEHLVCRLLLEKKKKNNNNYLSLIKTKKHISIQ
eukprot:TRINITY_DN16619_c0_g1_i4.p1 TRINITY_DN16619_c0_g1~~TRINITY_DN16619_c0_g1_i4.p1  ORF type:complete len:260 (+),score=59.32 TRINITY_DN16619_c0_g1_i4:179-958(+)